MIHICERQTYEHTFNGRTWLFEDSPYGGPWPVNKRTGELYNRIPMSFWDAHNDWLQQQGKEQHRGLPQDPEPL